MQSVSIHERINEYAHERVLSYLYIVRIHSLEQYKTRAMLMAFFIDMYVY